MTTALQDDLRVQYGIADDRAHISQITADLAGSGMPTAPHVVAKITRRLNGDAQAVRETAAELSPSQRSGLRALPELLPLVPSIAAEFDRLELSARDRFVLLIASLCAEAGLDLLMEAAQVDSPHLVAESIGEYLTVSRGQYSFKDARLSVWIRHAEPGVAIMRAHERLHQAHLDQGNAVHAAWHRARSAVERAADVAPQLTAVSRELHESGQTDLAFIVAVEAAEHATGAARDEACLVAGAAAVAAGCFEDGSDWLRSLFPHGDAEHKRQALASMLIAETYVRGTVPVLDPSEHRPLTTDARHWSAWARTAGLAAVMCAERGAIPGMRVWLTELRDAELRAGAQGEIRDSVVALCWMLTGDQGEIGTLSRGPFSGGVVGSLRTAVDGDIELALQMLGRAQSGLLSEVDPLIAGFERSPLIGAYLAVTETLLLFWRGDIGAARERLLAASIDLPIAVPFAGLGVTLAHRLDIMFLGAPGVLPQVLMATLPAGIRVDNLVDQSLRAYLDGEHEQAATNLRLWHDRGAPQPALSVPGLDEVGPLVMGTRIEPPELAKARELRHRIRTIPEASWRRERDAVAEAARGLSSSFCRARVEAMLGSVSVVHEDLSAGRRHLRAARCLFEESGALAWQGVVDVKINRLAMQQQVSEGIVTAPINVIDDSDAVENSWIVWSEVLTEREVEVSMRVVRGLTNSEIATELDISVRTVEVHVSKAFHALAVRNRVELTVLAHRTGQYL
ncbi:response regulator transcription factor [Microbacterium sp. A196]|uniref:response regulator transcription factor n=1 Tax=Microbacterium sp. A196 TaxID=3457320 RepID=UPI003FD615F3